MLALMSALMEALQIMTALMEALMTALMEALTYQDARRAFFITARYKYLKATQNALELKFDGVTRATALQGSALLRVY